MPHATARAPFSPYQRRLFVFLSVATFFEGYDFMALTQILPNLRAEMGLSPTAGGVLVGVIGIGTVLACFLVRRADAWGRRRVLSITIAGYATFSFLTALAPNAWVFGALQLIANVFLIGEWAISMVVAAEEFPADRRGTVVGIIQAFASLGSIVCAGLVPLLVATPLGWRAVYVVGTVPLLLVAVARRGLRETRRFEAQGQPAAPRPLLRIWRTAFRGRLLELAAVWGLTYACTKNAVTFWKEFAIAERGLSETQVGLSISLAALVSLPLVFAAGKLLDRLGRRPGAAIIYLALVGGVVAAYTARGHVALTAALAAAIFGTSAVLAVLNSYTSELFPTELRAEAFAWSNNLLGRLGYVLSPALVGTLAEELGWGPSVALTSVFAAGALGVLLWRLPETRGRELEDTARLSP